MAKKKVSMGKTTSSKIKNKEGLNKDLKTSNEDVISKSEDLQPTNGELKQDTEQLTVQIHETQLLVEAISHLGEGVVITGDDLDWPGPKILFVNEAIHKITGYSRKELIGQTPRIFQGVNTDRKTLEMIKTKLSRGQSCLVELLNYRKDGTSYDAELYITPLFNAEGQRTNFVSIHRDITERKQFEIVLQESKKRLTAIMDTVAEVIITMDQYGIIQGMNPATERVFGYSEKELTGKDFSILLAEPIRSDKPDLTNLQYMKTTTPSVFGINQEFKGKNKHGSTFPMELTIDEIDHLDLYIAVARDISVRKELEKQVIEAASEENRRIGLELHDNIQQQLSGLKLLANTLCTQLQGENKKGLHISEITELANTLAEGITQSVNDVQLIAHGLVPVQVDAEGLRSSLTELASRTRQQYELNCDFHSDGEVQVVDNYTVTHLYRIAQEAVNNALKHSFARHIHISLSNTQKKITLKVTDDGIGIDDNKNSSSGMGLRIMTYRAGLIGAKLDIHQANDKGTEITCTLPLL